MTSALVTAENPNQSVSSQIMSATLTAALVTSQMDSPVPGPADVVAVGEIFLGAIAAGIAYLTIDRIIVSYKKINGNQAANQLHENGVIKMHMISKGIMM
jgi:hypothetical protein